MVSDTVASHPVSSPPKRFLRPLLRHDQEITLELRKHVDNALSRFTEAIFKVLDVPDTHA